MALQGRRLHLGPSGRVPNQAERPCRRNSHLPRLRRHRNGGSSTIRRFVGPFVAIFTVVGTSAGLLLALRKPDDKTDYWWLLPACFLVPVVLIGAWLLVSWFRAWADVHLRRAIGLTDRDQVIANLTAENLELSDQLGLLPSQLGRVYDEGIAEGFRRQLGLQSGQKVRPLPTNVLAMGGPELRLLATAARPTVIAQGARFTLADVVDDAPLGVLEVMHVTGEGQVFLKCVDRVRSDYWGQLDTLPTTESRVLLGTHLIQYNPFVHHSAPPPIPLPARADASMSNQETA